jgi:hypothetical protein
MRFPATGKTATEGLTAFSNLYDMSLSGTRIFRKVVVSP